MYVLNYIDTWFVLLTTRLMYYVSRRMRKLIVRRGVYYYEFIVRVMLQSCYAAPFQKKAVLKGLSKPWQAGVVEDGRL